MPRLLCPSEHGAGALLFLMEIDMREGEYNAEAEATLDVLFSRLSGRRTATPNGSSSGGNSIKKLVRYVCPA